MGEKNKEEVKKEDGGEGKKEEEKTDHQSKKEEADPPEIVLKVDMHCQACARKVARSLKGFQGVENVTADSKASKVVVKGKAADPIKVCERIQKKSGRKVELISPLPMPPPQDDSAQQDNKPPPSPVEVQKQEPPAVISVVLEVQMHCEACAQVLRKRIGKIKGVESVTTDMGNNQVVVKGVVDSEKLVTEVWKRTGKQATIVVKEEEIKKEEEKKGEEKKQPEEEKATEEKKRREEDAKEEGDDNKNENAKKSEYWPQKYYLEYAYAYPPQLFSDENPHACSLM